MSYTAEESIKLDRLAVDTVLNNESKLVALGYLQYEALRKLTPSEFKSLYLRNIQENIPFDRLVDELILK